MSDMMMRSVQPLYDNDEKKTLVWVLKIAENLPQNYKKYIDWLANCAREIVHSRQYGQSPIYTGPKVVELSDVNRISVEDSFRLLE
jgi:hypothetical protein